MSRRTFISALARRIACIGPSTNGHIREIARRCAEYHGIALSDMHTPTRLRAIAWPRQDAMRRIAHEGYSQRGIARYFSVDPSTVRHGIKAATARLRQTKGARK